MIRVEGLTRRYGKRPGVEGLRFEVPPGTLLGFLGPNGAGKTTTIRVLLGFLRPTAGRASISGLDCWRQSHQIKREVGYLPGDLRLYPSWDGRRFLRIFGAIRGLDRVPRGASLADRFALDLSVPVRRMSRGMRQKLGLILALAHDPRLLVLDEPTASLDPLMQESLLQLLRERSDAGNTVFFSSHTLSEVQRLCHRVCILRDGRLVADETQADLAARAERLVTIRWPDGTAPPAAPACLVIEGSSLSRWEARLTGPVSSLLEWLRDRPVADLTIGPPDLEGIFRRYYGETGRGP